MCINLQLTIHKNQMGFLSDPKVFLSLASFVLASLSLIYTCANQYEQNRRWDSLNASNPILKEIKMLTFKEMTKDEALKIDWGYDANIYVKGDGSEVAYIPYFLRIRKDQSGEILPNVNPVLKISEISSELQRIKYAEKVKIYKVFKPSLIIENTGKTIADQLSIKIQAKTKGQDWQNAFNSNSIISLAGDQSTSVYFEIEFPIYAQMPEDILLKIQIQWVDIHSTKQSKIINAKWSSKNNQWSYISDE
jgi:hypothetical protein